MLTSASALQFAPEVKSELCELPHRPTKDIASLFERPVITGASVSADKNSLSPGKKLSQRLAFQANVRTIARGGQPGYELIKQIQGNDLNDRSVVIAVDFFFWDSFLRNPSRSLAALTRLSSWTGSLGIPLILREIPELISDRQPSRKELNTAIHAEASQNPSVFVMPFDRLHRRYLRDGFLIIQGGLCTLRDLLPDGLHLSNVAGEYLADVLEATINGDTLPFDTDFNL
ncbi:MAG: hypothetical protein H7301_12360 [Cryobacterium sp.]|nr:hypothetical protein [Oligoflexia bacterium]